MLNNFIKYISDNNLFSKQDKIILTVSGGADSITMLDLFSKANFSFAIAHCNFNLRGNDSVKDAEFVEALSKKHNAPFYTISFDTINYSKENGISIEMAARELRYNWFEKIRIKDKYNFIATAHHKDDLIETLFINLSRGCGISGLTGFKNKSNFIIRPMLFANKNDIDLYVKQNKLDYKHDYTNDDTEIIRNNFRHKIIPLFEKINPNFKNSILKSINNFNDIEKIYFKSINTEKNNIITANKNIIKIDIKKLLNLEASKTYLYEFLKEYNFNSSNVDDIYASLTSQSGKIFYSKTHILNKDRDFLIINKIESKNNNINIISADIKSISKPIKLKFESKNNKVDFKTTNNNIAYLDKDKLKFPLRLRLWENGDYFYPLGMNKKKKMSDFLIDNKISLIEKENIYVLTSDENIIWIVGHRIDNRFKITDETKDIIKITYIK